MRKTSWIATTLFATAVLMPMSLVFAGEKQGRDCPQCGCEICQPVGVVLKEKKHCWKVECKRVCIPAPRMPWDKSCEPKPGVVKTIKVLTRVDYECEKCGWKLELQKPCAPCLETTAPIKTSPAPAAPGKGAQR